jgi:hypothetical protein
MARRYFRNREHWLLIAAINEDDDASNEVMIEYDSAQPPTGCAWCIVNGRSERGREYISKIKQQASNTEIDNPAREWVEVNEDNIEETSLTSANGQTDWTSAIYNRSLSDREGYLMFNINKGANPGFDVSVSHQLNAKSYLAGVNIPEEDAELMSSPVESFLGWQANRDNETPVAERRLFNAKLITEAIEYMTNQLARIRIAKQQGGSIAEAIESTNQMILNSQVPTNNMGQATNDPILAQQAEMASKESTNRNQTTNAEAVIAKNNDPQNPAAAHLDPITGAPVAESSNFGNSNFGRGWNTPETADDTFQKPSFAGGNGQNLPF